MSNLTTRLIVSRINTMKPKSLTGISSLPGSVVAIRFIVIFISFVWSSLIISTINSSSFHWPDAVNLLYPSVLVACMLYALMKFSGIFYNDENVIIQNFYGKVIYPKSEFLDIRIVSSFFSLYQICFRDGRKFLFGEPNRYLAFADSTASKVEEMKKKLL
ncbi:hypothetical protein [Dyadobacter sp. BHUBP1]|uniref:hypothetical protein n=1 Tax=Dyadobacter sp. BHUBP1 TaxID=3424178 RepID=UPI003D33AC4A